MKFFYREIRKPLCVDEDGTEDGTQFGGVQLNNSCLTRIGNRLADKSHFLYDYRHFLWMQLANHEILH